MIPKMTVTAALTLWVLHEQGGKWSVGALAEKVAPGSPHLVRTGLKQLERFRLADKVRDNREPQRWEVSGNAERINEVLAHYHEAMSEKSFRYRRASEAPQEDRR